MKLLLDENLSRRLVPFLQHTYPGTSQIVLLGLNGADDRQIWLYAKQHNYAIVTQDADFHEQNLLYGEPPLVIWLRCGNKPKQVILSKLLNHLSDIETAESDPAIWCIEIH